MATVTITQSTPGGLHPDLLPFIDMTTLSQSELLFLSSSTFSNLHLSTTDPITPTIDPTFNESAGSRGQTYSRPSPHHHHHRHRLAGLLPKPPTTTTTTNSPLPTEPDRLENHSIITSLKTLLSSHPEFQQAEYSLEFNSFTHFNNPINYTLPPPPQPQQPPSSVHVNFRLAAAVERKRKKRGRKPKKIKVMGSVEEERLGLEIVNQSGVRVDLVALAGMEEDPFKDELRRRTEGMEKEDELLGFFRGLGGQWCSRRKKRKIVDASEFGDTLPVGWKLLLGLKRKEGRAWVYCRRYIRCLLINSFVFDSCVFILLMIVMIWLVWLLRNGRETKE